MSESAQCIDIPQARAFCFAVTPHDAVACCFFASHAGFNLRRFSKRGAHLVSSSEDGSALIIDAFDLQVVGRWTSDTAISAVDCANIQSATVSAPCQHALDARVREQRSLCLLIAHALTTDGHLACGDETGLITILATRAGLCGRWHSF